MNFATSTDLLPHQVDAVAKLLPTRVGGLFMDMGTGKSRTAIELARLRQSKIDRVVWFCPVSVKPTIRYQILRHTDCPPDAVCVFDDEITERTLPLDSAQWFIVGIESMSSSARVILSAWRLVTADSLVIVDESTFIKGHHAKRTERITRLAQDCRYRLILTGTPFTQGAVDLYAQMRFLSPKILGYSSWYSFAANHIQWSDRYRGKIERTLNTEWLAAKIRPYVYQVTKDEALSLPVKRQTPRLCDLTSEQWAAYEEAKRVFVEEVMLEEMEHPHRLQSSVPIFRLFTTLQSIVCGFAGDERYPHRRLDLLLGVLAEIPAPERVVIWAKYRVSTQEIVEALTRHYGAAAVCEYHGSLNPKRREAELERWRASGRFLVARQSVGAYGLDLTAAHWVVFYANSFKYSERIQAEDRCHRLGQTHPVTYIDLWAECKIEDRVAAALAGKSSVLKDFRAEVDKVKAGRKHKLRQWVEELV